MVRAALIPSLEAILTTAMVVGWLFHGEDGMVSGLHSAMAVTAANLDTCHAGWRQEASDLPSRD
jgi:hypothetical protein